MKDKLKGLMIGLTVGSMVAGTAAYASSAQIDVVFKNLKYMFDGVEKKSDAGESFIYQNKTYVPLRFVSEALGKDVKWDEANQTIWIADPKLDADTAAIYKGGTLSNKEFATFLGIMQLYNPSYTASLSDASFKSQMLKENIALKILADRGHALSTKSLKDEAAAQLVTLKSLYTQAFPGQATLEQRLIDLKLTEADVQNYIEARLLGNVYLSSKVSDGELRDEYIKNLSLHTYDIATVSHILISLTLADGKVRTKEEALAIANEVESKLSKGDDFAALAKQYSDDAGSKDNGGQYANANVNGWVAEFKKAVIELPLNKISNPVLSQFGYHIIRVDSRSTTKYDDVKDALSSSLIQKIYQDFNSNELPGLITSQNVK